MAASAELIGSRDSNGNGVWASDGWTAGKFSIAWNISCENNRWRYQYTINADPELSHWILQVSPGRVIGDFSNFSPASPEGPKTYNPDDSGQSTPNLPGPIYGLKWNTTSSGTTHTFVFEIEYQPV